MFSGIIEHIAKFETRQGNRIRVSHVGFNAKLGDSVAVNGVCLTVAAKSKGRLAFDVSRETLAKTTVKDWEKGQDLNVEPALGVASLLGGHIVQGHVDGTGLVTAILRHADSVEVRIEGPREVMPYVVPKGSITVDGVSLTAVRVDKRRFSVALIPFTLKHTTLKKLRTGDRVNLEADIIGKYVAAYLKKK